MALINGTTNAGELWLGLWRGLVLAAIVGAGAVAWTSVETLTELRTEVRLLRQEVTRQLADHDERLRYLERRPAGRAGALRLDY